MKNNVILVAILSILLGATIGLVTGLWFGFLWGYDTRLQKEKLNKEISEMLESIEESNAAAQSSSASPK